MSRHVDTRCSARTIASGLPQCRNRAEALVDGRGLCGMHAGMARDVAVRVAEVREWRFAYVTRGDVGEVLDACGAMGARRVTIERGPDGTARGIAEVG